MSKTKNLNGLNKLEAGGLLDGLCIDHDNSGNIFINKRPEVEVYYSGDGTDSCKQMTIDTDGLKQMPVYTDSWEQIPVYSEKSLKESIAKAAKQLIDEGEDPEDILEEVELAVKDHKKKARKHNKKQKENLNLWKNLTK